MNSTRRRRAQAIAAQLVDLRQQIEGLARAEQEALDALPERLQESPQGAQVEEAAERAP